MKRKTPPPPYTPTVKRKRKAVKYFQATRRKSRRPKRLYAPGLRHVSSGDFPRYGKYKRWARKNARKRTPLPHPYGKHDAWGTFGWIQR